MSFYNVSPKHLGDSEIHLEIPLFESFYNFSPKHLGHSEIHSKIPLFDTVVDNIMKSKRILPY